MVIQICLQIWSSPHLTSKTFSELWEFYICSLPPQSQTGAEKKKQSQSRERKWTKNFFGGPRRKKQQSQSCLSYHHPTLPRIAQLTVSLGCGGHLVTRRYYACRVLNLLNTALGSGRLLVPGNHLRCYEEASRKWKG